MGASYTTSHCLINRKGLQNYFWITFTWLFAPLTSVTCLLSCLRSVFEGFLNNISKPSSSGTCILGYHCVLCISSIKQKSYGFMIICSWKDFGESGTLKKQTNTHFQFPKYQWLVWNRSEINLDGMDEHIDDWNDTQCLLCFCNSYHRSQTNTWQWFVWDCLLYWTVSS